jgi:hypothetical protein
VANNNVLANVTVEANVNEIEEVSEVGKFYLDTLVL